MLSHINGELWDLSNDIAEHRSVVKNNQIKHYLRSSSALETGIALAKTDVLVFTVLFSTVHKY